MQSSDEMQFLFPGFFERMNSEARKRYENFRHQCLSEKQHHKCWIYHGFKETLCQVLKLKKKVLKTIFILIHDH